VLLLRCVETDAERELQKLQIPADEFEISEDPFAKGGFGKVYEARWKRKNEKVVVKVIKVDNDEERQHFMDEASLTLRLRHSNVIQLFGITTLNRKKPAIVMEMAEHGSLDKWIGKIDHIRMAKVALAIIHGVEYIHLQHVIHRDIKPQNILMCGPDDDMIPKIADFGVSKLIQTAVKTHTRVGQDLYMAPEVKMFNHYSFPADIYSLAMTLFEMFNEQPILQSSEEVMRFILSVASGRIGKFPQSCKVPVCLRGVIERGWQENQEKRPKLAEYRSALEGYKYFQLYVLILV